ncbi:hypothetical protein HPB51_027058 [Rhipicephalus microplus]|uniref:Peptidase M13 C-terminal domain-containing protein n=1 Tax=Rhipicephalus microplus TaxID=6941 RepID=A0A9J6D1I9_RHIMP|nr:hypothetical protein HPB51_027058 [Rhipicephalus microplus]
MHQQSSQSEDMGLASQPSSASRSSAALPTAFRMSRRDLIATALLVSGASAIVVTAAIAVRNRHRPEPLPSLLDLKPPRDNPWQTRHLPLYFECHMKLKSEKEFFLESTSLGGAMVQFLYRAFHERTLFSVGTADQNEHRKTSATACLEKQYGSKAINSTKVNGRRVLRAVAADNALVPVLHKAFKTSLYIHKIEVINYKRLEMSLASLPDVDADQLFFLMYGQTLCEPHEDTARVLAEAPWPPAKIRLNMALANYPEFAKAFKCGNDTAMNPKKRCSLFNSN